MDLLYRRLSFQFFWFCLNKWAGEEINERTENHTTFCFYYESFSNLHKDHYRTSDLHEMIKLSDDLLANVPLSGFITDTWSRDTIPWEMSIVVSCGALFWWKYLSE